MLVAIAYRFGQIDNHNYLITASDEIQSDIEKRLIFIDASSVHHNRGGKYGVAIWYVTKPGREYNRKLIYYFPSSFGEEEPYEDGSFTDAKKLNTDLETEISLCEAQVAVEKAAGNAPKEWYWSGKKTGLRWAKAYINYQNEN